MKFCPECGTSLIPGNRYCYECGFDTLTIQIKANTETDPLAKIEVNPVEITPSVFSEQEKPKQLLCPQCATAMDKDDRFCPECGFDTSLSQPERAGVFKTLDLPESNRNSNPLSDSAEQELLPISPIQNPVISPPDPTPVSGFQSNNVPPVSTREPVIRPKRKKTWLWIALVILGLGTIGAGGLYVYNTYFASTDENTVDTEKLAAPEVSNFESTPPETQAAQESPAELPAEVTPEKPKTQTKSLSRVDQELAKYKAKEQTKSATQTLGQAEHAKPESGVKITGNTAVAMPPIKVLMEVGKKEDPKSKNPKNPAKLTIQKSTMVIRITTDHYNDGMGTASAGSITLKDKEGNVIGTFRASGRSGKNGTPNAKWIVQPNQTLEKGTYYIWDSDMSTWSKTFLGSGFVVVEGYEIE